MLGRALFAAGSHEASAARFEEAIALSQVEEPAAATETLLDYALASWMTGGPGKSLPLAARARKLAQAADEAMRRRAEAAWTHSSLLSGDAVGLEPMAVMARAVEADPLSHAADLSWSWGAFNTYAGAANLTERFADAERVYRVALEAAERQGAPEGVAALSCGYAYTLSRLGRLAEALEYIGRASALGDLLPMLGPAAGAGQAYILLQMGRDKESQSWCERVETTLLARGEWLFLLYLWDVYGQRHLRDGRVAEAGDIYARAEATTNRMGLGEPCLVMWARHGVAAYLGCNYVEEAGRVIAWLERCAAGLPCRWPRIAALTGRGLLADRSGDQDGAETHFRAALALHEEVELPLEKVETLLTYGGFLRRTGQPVRARPLLAEALQLAESAGAGWLAGQAREELKVAGGRRRPAREPERLTAQEERVARLAGTGLSNQDIARRLFLSVATVESHLHQVYARLGIRSRRELILRAGELFKERGGLDVRVRPISQLRPTRRDSLTLDEL
jgi:DNA-binding CsgD family transcriptional regulator